MNQKALRTALPWSILAVTFFVLGCGEAATGPGDKPDPSSQLGDVSVSASMDPVIAVGWTIQLTATVTAADGNTVSMADLSWETSNPDVATVNSTGLVTGTGPGEVTVTAKYQGLGGSVALTVIEADLDAIAQLRNDPLLNLLVDRLDGDLASQLTSALNDLDAAVTVGNCVAVKDALEAAIANISSSTSASDVISLAVLGLALERAQDLLGL